ncbi:MAG: TOBE domain-containing protein, partial [Solimonas sp.]
IYITHDQGEALTMSDRVAVMSQGVIQQIGDGHTIYNSPQTAFVASFVGENNPFFGKVARAEGDHAILDTPFGPLRGRNPKRARVGEDAILFIRPEGLRLGAEGGDNLFESEVLTNELEGSMVHIRLAGTGQKAITVSLTNDGTAVAAKPGLRLKASFDPERAVVLAKGPLADE